MKRAVEVSIAVVLVVLVSPVLLLAAVAILVDDGPPVFFRQERAGRQGRRFEVLKFRTLRNNLMRPEDLGQVRVGHPLVTRSGALLRRLKLDELPQLVNVLKGEMSLVGPRPALVSDVDAYTSFERRRLEVRPGLTGWAQVNGNTEISWAERILLDVWYVDHRTFLLDVRILWQTLLVILRGERPRPSTIRQAREHAIGLHRRG